MIETDIKALQIHIGNKKDEIVVPDFIEDPGMRDEAYQMLSYAMKYRTVDIRDTKLIPTPVYRGPDFDERLRELIDIDAHIEESAQELKDYANKRIPLPAKDLNEKDSNLLSKVSLMA